METNNEAKEKKASSQSNKLIIAIVALIVVVIAATGVIVYVLLSRDSQEPNDNGLTIGYATDASVFLDQDALQAAVDNDLANSGYVSLMYQNDAISSDGRNFSCYIVNANGRDMFLTICADADMTDQLFLSQLIPPGSGFEQITLNRQLARGTHTVYVAVTLVVTNENGAQTIAGQVIHTMDFYVE